MSVFQKASKKQAYLRMAIAGPSGSGKTYTALRIGTSLGDRVALIDTEHGSAAKYADVFDFFTVDLTPPYSPERYVELIEAAESEGMDVVVIDSLTHAWKGEGGILEIVDKIKARNKGGGGFQAWKDATPRHRKLIDAMLATRVDLIATMRSKVEHAMEKDDSGKMRVTKKGMAPIQRDGIEYEFDIFSEMDMEHRMIVSKSRFDEMQDAVYEKPGEAVADKIRTWLSDGEPTEREKAIEELEAALDSVDASAQRREKAKNWASTQSDPTSIRNAASKIRDESEPKSNGRADANETAQQQPNSDAAEGNTDAAEAMMDGETALDDDPDKEAEDEAPEQEDGTPTDEEGARIQQIKKKAHEKLSELAEVSFADVEQQASLYLKEAQSQPMERQVAVREVVERYGVSPLPHDFPHVDKLREAGLFTLQSVQQEVRTDGLESVDGVGQARAEEVAEALEAQDFRSLPDPEFEKGTGDDELPFD